MRLPSTIRIGYLDHTLEVVPILDGGENVGEYRFEERAMRLVENDIRVMVQRLMHECNHGILCNAGLDENAELAPHEETLCQVFAMGWLQIFRDNPWLLAFIEDAIRAR